tara:strand:+ start:27 stop:539 length:513 start_codon:yes stop_codon:yes gene_type:complete
MAYNKKYPKLERVSPHSPYSNRFGIKLSNLARQQKRLLIENPILGERCESDQFVHIIFNICQHRYTSSKNKYYYDWSTDSFVKMEDLKENYNTIDWVCALSGKPIRAKTDNFSLENFVHPEYHDALLAPMVDARILKSSIEFRKHIKKLLLNQQQEFLNLARKNSKKNLD